ncbi:MAG: NAD-dependent epimerase/dehydratase family protein [Flavobacteriia bacterium]|nr:NAD-dependent epimerase/dehydratase family protein [Flavobacteriia bacterium]
MNKVLVIGSCGQIGTELIPELCRVFPDKEIFASDIKVIENNFFTGVPYVQLDVLDKASLRNFILNKKIDEVYLLAAILSATGEKNPELAWKLNMESLLSILDLGKEGVLKKIYWPSSIAVFGPNTPKIKTPQFTIMEPNTVYGISKLAGERWCAYYHEKFGVDVRSLRYPGLISYGSLPGGGTTDYAVDIFYQAKANLNYTCFLEENTSLPMMYMKDAVRATIELMKTDRKKLSVHSSYNLAGISFTPKDLFLEIKKHIPTFEIQYKADFRQQIADSWPDSIDDSYSVKEWFWKEEFTLEKMVKIMLENVDIKKMSNI